MSPQDIAILLVIAVVVLIIGYKAGFKKAKNKYQPPSKGSLHQPDDDGPGRED